MSLPEDAKIVDDNSLVEAGYSVLVVGIVATGLVAAFAWNTGELFAQLSSPTMETRIIQGTVILLISAFLMLSLPRENHKSKNNNN